MNAPHPPQDQPKSQIRWGRIAFLALVYGAILAAGHYGGHWLSQSMGFEPGTKPSLKRNGIFWTGLAAYTALLALPFVPGIEISMALFAAFGSAIAWYVYAATVAALTLAYLAGRLIPVRVIASVFHALGMERARALVLKLDPLTPHERLAALMEQAPTRFAPAVLRYRYVALAIALNTPGNAVLGGGGGIALLAGMSGLFSATGYLIAILIAALPIPLATTLAVKLF